MAAHTMLPPLSPLSQYINTPTLTFFIMGVIELEVAFDKSETLNFLKHSFRPLNKRFSSAIVTDEKGVQRWKKVESPIEDHLVIPTFPPNLSPKEYEEHLEEYISDMYMTPLPESHSPWQVHLITYPTPNAAGSLVFKLHHSLGDGYSFMGALFTLFRKADDPSAPLKLPTMCSRLSEQISSYTKLSNMAYRCYYTLSDFAKGILGMYLEDDKHVLRSGAPKVEYKPVNIASVTFSLDDIKAIKNKVEGTVNDVTTGVMAYALQLYMKRVGQEPINPVATAAIVMNMRMYRGFKSLEEMLKANIWGNHFHFVSVPLPMTSDLDNVDPLDYVTGSKAEMKKKMNSLGAYFSSKFVSLLGSLRGTEAAAEYIHSNLRNTTFMVSNMCGPQEKASLAGHTLKGFYFTVPGIPQSLVFSIVTYMGKLRLVAASEKGFIDSRVLNSCVKEAFQKIYVAAMGENPLKIY
ncbi:hypothetical protein Sjap_018960 [Stephania japonica]|uniref:Diacylglycerol O-acyltransferase n=1 Tax=Stephania japonica TaxID=461633 RepID=A0AAP0EXU4_9MAGN